MASVIRHPQRLSPPAFSFADLSSQAARLLDDARVESARIVAQAQYEARAVGEQIRADARTQGLAEGRREGLAAIRAEASAQVLAERRAQLDELSEALRTALTEFEAQKRRILAAGERELIHLAVAIARRVCKWLPERSIEPAAANLGAVLELARHEQDLELLVNPAELEQLQAVATHVLNAVASHQHVTIRADERVARGGCRLMTRSGTIDATIETQLDRVAAELLGESA